MLPTPASGHAMLPVGVGSVLFTTFCSVAVAPSASTVVCVAASAAFHVCWSLLVSGSPDSGAYGALVML